MKKVLVVGLVLLLTLGLSYWVNDRGQSVTLIAGENSKNVMAREVHPLSIEFLRQQDLSGSDLDVERELDAGSNYQRYLASYKSEGLKIFGLLTIPDGEKPVDGWPVIIFNHGWIPPQEYVPWERYVAYVDELAKNGYIVFRPDYRGHWESEGTPEGAYGSNAYSIDVLNAVATLKNFSEADAERIGMWGHSLGGFLTLRALVVDADIKAAVVWGGVVGSYQDIYEKWWLARARERAGDEDIPARWKRTRNRISELRQNTDLMKLLSANTFLEDMVAPIQLHHSTTDETVPVVLSKDLHEDLDELGKVNEYYEYPGDNHNISDNFGVAMNRTVNFFDKYLKSDMGK